METPWIICLPTCLVASLFLLAPAAYAEPWELENGLAITRPSVTNSNIVQLEVGCGDPYHLGVFTQHGAVLTKDGLGEADYFYEPGRIEAVIDGNVFPLVAAGSGDAVILLAEGTKEDNYLADIEESFITTLKEGSELLLRFDVVSENAADGAPFETYAMFLLSGAQPVIDEALLDCGS